MPSEFVKEDMPKHLDLLSEFLFADLHRARDAFSNNRATRSIAGPEG